MSWAFAFVSPIATLIWFYQVLQHGRKWYMAGVVNKFAGVVKFKKLSFIGASSKS